MSAHDHSTFVEGCYRCDLSRDEVTAYTPTTEDALGDEIARVRHGQNVTASDLANRLMPWLAAHDAEVHAEWEAEQGETEWEYARMNRLGNVCEPDDDLADAQRRAEASKWAGGYNRVVRRHRASEWAPVPDTTGAES